jgi:hypothetical protein
VYFSDENLLLYSTSAFLTFPIHVIPIWLCDLDRGTFWKINNIANRLKETDMCICCGKNFPFTPKLFTWWHWPFIDFQNKSDMRYCVKICIQCVHFLEKTFPAIPGLLTLWLWYWPCTYFWN